MELCIKTLFENAKKCVFCSRPTDYQSYLLDMLENYNLIVPVDKKRILNVILVFAKHTLLIWR